jgi:hypothetical protein
MGAVLLLSVGMAGTASAGVPTVPAFPTGASIGYPTWIPANGSVANVDHSEGSDTTLFVMQQIDDLYAQAGINPFSCTLNSNNLGNCAQPSWSVNTTGATGGTFGITIQGYPELTGIPYNVTAATLQTELSSGTNGPTTTTVTGGPVYVITVPYLTVSADFSGLTSGTDTITEGANPNVTQTDTVDNFAGSEQLAGVWNVGSGNGLNALCGLGTLPANTVADYARSSKPASGCSNLVQTGYAKDSVTATDFQQIQPANYGDATGYAGNGYFSYDPQTGQKITTDFPSTGLIGPVADGWLPGDNTNCGTGGGSPCSGTAYTDVDNTPTQSGDSASAAAYRLWCKSGSSTNPGDSQITDWGNLSNVGPTFEILNVSLTSGSETATIPGTFPSTIVTGDTITGPDIPASTTVNGAPTNGNPTSTLQLSQPASNTATDTVKITATGTWAGAAPPGTGTLPTGAVPAGYGSPIGVPIRIIGVNLGSGTAAAWNGFTFGNVGGTGNCSGKTLYNETAAQGANPQNPQGPTGNTEIALENDASQIGDFANANWGGNDAADQSVDIATSLYYMGRGAYNTNPNSSVASLELNSGVSVGSNPTAFTEYELNANNVAASGPTQLSNAYPVARTLFNVFKTDTVRASVGGYLNWLCDTNSVSYKSGSTTYTFNGAIQKGTNHVDGGNYDTDLSNIIVNQYGFTRLTDLTPELNGSVIKTANNVVNPNASCMGNLTIASTGTNTITIAGGSVPASVQPGWTVMIPLGYNVKLATAGAVSNGFPGDTLDTISSINYATGVITLTHNLVSATGSAPTTLYLPGRPPVLAVHDPNS